MREKGESVTARARAEADRVHAGGGEVLLRGARDSTGSGGLLVPKICRPSRGLPLLFQTAQSLVKPLRAQAMNLLLSVLLLELLEPGVVTQSLLLLRRWES